MWNIVYDTETILDCFEATDAACVLTNNTLEQFATSDEAQARITALGLPIRDA